MSEILIFVAGIVVGWYLCAENVRANVHSDGFKKLLKEILEKESKASEDK